MEVTIVGSFSPSVEGDVTQCTECWDLREMLPRKFRKSAVMMDYLHAVSQLVNSVACRIGTLGPLIDIDTCPKRYLGHLAALIGYKLKNAEYATTKQLRNQLKMAIEMYKAKGTYRVLDIAFYLVGLNVTLYDLWTRDYLNFERQPAHRHSGIPPEFGGWETPEALHIDDGYFMDETTPAGGGGTSAPWHFDGGLGFKSPHFDLIINLDRLIYFQGYYNKLFVHEYWDLLAELVAEYTPLNTVPHYFLELYAMTYENYQSYEIVDSQIKTCLTNNWAVSKLFFDQQPPDDIYLDQVAPDEIYLDQSFESMLSELTTIKIGDGNKGATPQATDTDLANIIWTGTVTGYTLTENKITFRATVPAGVELTDASELGIYHTATGDLVIESFFPDLDKPSAAVLEITIDVIRQV